MTRNSFIVVHADQDPAARGQLASFLDGKGFTVHQCSNGVEALALCESLQPGILLMDLDMPELDGFETARRVRANAGLAHIVMVALSANSDEYASARAWEAGFNEFLSKPVSMSLVLQVIRRTQEMAAIKLREPNSFPSN